MKLRLRPHSIRLRLGPREVQALLAVGSLEETLCFGSGDAQLLRYRLLLSIQTHTLSARLDGREIVVTLPRSTAETWANDPGLTLESHQPTGDGQTLQILVEKDLKCLESTNESEEDVYPNPSADCNA